MEFASFDDSVVIRNVSFVNLLFTQSHIKRLSNYCPISTKKILIQLPKTFGNRFVYLLSISKPIGKYRQVLLHHFFRKLDLVGYVIDLLLLKERLFKAHCGKSTIWTF
jgi:hypothetical protein